MRNITKMRDLYLRDKAPVRMGNVASSLLRLSEWVKKGQKEEAVIDLTREIAWLMEWCGDLASPELADMEREIWSMASHLASRTTAGHPCVRCASDVEPGLGIVRAAQKD